MNRNTLFGLGGLVAGLLIGFFIGRSTGGGVRVIQGAPAPVAAAPQQGAAAGSLQRIAMLEQVTAREPANVQAWVQLGNEYFDTRQPKKAIDAYQRALDQQPNDPNVLTDQGVMYRELGQSEAALKNFLKASQVDPKHLQSRFNAGIVYAYDLKDTAKAAAAWEELTKIAPTSPQAVQAKQHLAQLQGQGAGGGAPAR